MTRLITEWLTPIKENMDRWDKTLRENTGCDLATLAYRAAVSDPANRLNASVIPDAASQKSLSCGDGRDGGSVLAGMKACVVTVTSGEGEIGHFAQSVAGILDHMGMDAKATKMTDVAGIYEAVQEDADVVFMADDDRYIALGLKTGACGENDRCTALGYLQVLEECCRKERGRGIAGEKVLMIGYGRVGMIMYELLKARGAVVTVYDKSRSKQDEIDILGIKQIRVEERISDYSLIVDLSSEGGWLDVSGLAEGVIIAAPGVPLSVRDEDIPRIPGRIFHDDLEIGTAVMAMAALAVEPPQGGT